MWVIKNDDTMYRIESFDKIYYDGSYTWGHRQGQAPVMIAKGNVVTTIDEALCKNEERITICG